jgi:hypothetical protein
VSPWRRRRRRRIYALVQFRDEMRYLPGLFENLAGQVDGVIAIDDQSSDDSAAFVAAQPLVRELLRVAPGELGELEDRVLHRRLTEAAWEHDARWLLGVDADERLEEAFRARAEGEIARAEAAGEDALWVHFRELWDRPDRMRVDGLWGAKRKLCLYRSAREHVFHDGRLHLHWASMATAPEERRQADLRIYHLRMIEPQDRRARVARYERLDPDHEHQPIGYRYMLDEQGIERAALEPGRGYRPLAG